MARDWRGTTAFQASCDATTDLRFYFGVQTPEVTTALTQSGLQNPVAFANRESYDLDKGWGRGFIWFARLGSALPASFFPDWTKSNALFGVVLHEIGHTLGCTHVPGTIMDQNLSRFIIRDDHAALDADRLARIDQRAELVSCDTCKRLFIGTMSFPFEDNAPNIVSFKLFTGRAPVGPISVELKMGYYDGPTLPGKSLILTDSIGSTAFPLTRGAVSISRRTFFSERTLFKAALRDPKTGQVTTDGFASTGEVDFGEMKTSAGESVMWIYSHNVDIIALARLSYVRKGKEFSLFVISEPWL